MITDHGMNHVQREYLQSLMNRPLTDDERENLQVFLACGKLDCTGLYNTQTGNMYQKATLRGVVVDDRPFETGEAALAAGRAVQEKWLVNTQRVLEIKKRLPPSVLNEAHAQLFERQEDYGITLDPVLHLPSFYVSPHVQSRALEDGIFTLLHDAKQYGRTTSVAAVLNSLDARVHAYVAGEPDPEADPDERNDRHRERERTEEMTEIVAEQLRDAGWYGWLVRASFPEREYHIRDVENPFNSYSFSEGFRTGELFYMDNLNHRSEIYAWADERIMDWKREAVSRHLGTSALAVDVESALHEFVNNP